MKNGKKESKFMKENDFVIWGVNIGIVKKDKNNDLYVKTTEGLNLSLNLNWEITKNKKIIYEIKTNT